MAAIRVAKTHVPPLQYTIEIILIGRTDTLRSISVGAPDSHWFGASRMSHSTIVVARTGKNPITRHLERTRGISIAWLHDMFKRDEYALVFELSSKRLPTHTPRHSRPVRWKHGCLLVNLFDPGSTIWQRWRHSRRRTLMVQVVVARDGDG